MKDQFEYNRLPGSGRSSLGFGRSSLWLGSDHVLLLQRRAYVEDYKRFYYRDIHAIVIRKTSTFFIINMIFGLLLIACLLLHFLGMTLWEWDRIGHIILGIWTGLFFLVLAVNSLKGATCSTKLQTAVHSEPISCMSRVRTSLRTANILRSKIEEVQGHLSDESLLQHPGFEVPPLLIPPPVKGMTKNVMSDYKGGVHLALFGLLLFDAAQTAFGIFNRGKILFALNVIINGVLWALIVTALIKQRRSELPRSVTGLTWGVLIYGALFYTFSYFFFMIFAMQEQVSARSQWDWVKKLWQISPLDHPALLFLMVFSIACSLSLGIPGLISLLRARAKGRFRQEQAIAGDDAA